MQIFSFKFLAAVLFIAPTLQGVLAAPRHLEVTEDAIALLTRRGEKGKKPLTQHANTDISKAESHKAPQKSDKTGLLNTHHHNVPLQQTNPQPDPPKSMSRWSSSSEGSTSKLEKAKQKCKKIAGQIKEACGL